MVLFKNVVKLSSQNNIGTSPLGPALIGQIKKNGPLTHFWSRKTRFDPKAF